VSDPDMTAPGPDEAGYAPRQERSIAALLAGLADDMRALFRLELALFKAELTEKLRRLGRGAVALAIGVFLMLSGWALLLAAATLALALVVRPWLAALIIAIAAAAVGGVLLYLGKRWLNPDQLVPRRSLASLRADKARIGEGL
jgi:Putative Actinobacterial Holin-X, holin superfamily III